MNLLCPNCQKMLQVPEQYAGQMMKCPMCSGSFTVPALPGAPAPTPVMAAATAPASTARSREAAMLAQGSDEDEITARPRSDSVPQSTSGKAPPAPPEGYTRTKSYTLNARAVPLLAPVALGLVFVLTFFPWVGLYPGGESAGSQMAWGAAFGSFTPDPVWEAAYRETRNPTTMPAYDSGQMRMSFLAMFFLFLFILFMLPLAILSVLIGQGRLKLPPGVESILPYRSVILAGVILAGFLLLLFQTWAGFGLENMVKEMAEKSVEADRRDATKKPEFADFKKAQIVAIFNATTTSWFRLALLLLIVAAIGAGLDFWLQRRGSRPLPRADLMW
jgi:hypothetical protein